jgi:hypothetical protein
VADLRLHLGIGGDSCLYCGFGADRARVDNRTEPMQTYSRQEAITAAAINSNKLQYYERMFGIAPQRVASGKKNYCFYTYEQVVLIGAIESLHTYKANTALMVKAFDRLFAETGVLDKPAYYALEQAAWDVATLFSKLSMPTDFAWQIDLCCIPATTWKLAEG